MCVYGNLIEIVRTAPLQRDQLFYGRKVDVQDIPCLLYTSVYASLSHLSRGEMSKDGTQQVPPFELSPLRVNVARGQ